LIDARNSASDEVILPALATQMLQLIKPLWHEGCAEHISAKRSAIGAFSQSQAEPAIQRFT
jgi:hypothetical protein